MDGLKIYKGWLSHQRTKPTLHSFRYKVFQIWLDTERPELIDQISIWWSTKKPNLVRFDRKKFMPGPCNLYAQVCEKIRHQTGNQFNGKVFLLANLSYWGYCINPVSFYCCYEDDELRYFLSEVHNTPWGERFTYVHDIPDTNPLEGNSGTHIAQFDKAFHVSPFMPMDLDYEWQYKIENQQILICMNLMHDGAQIFNATLNLQGSQLTRNQANWLPFKYPFMCIKVVGAIYWNALRLWLKRVPFFSHPDRSATP